jgi:hypothetical protein
MHDSNAFKLEHDTKITFFDCYSSWVTNSHFWKARPLEMGHQSKSSEQIL